MNQVQHLAWHGGPCSHTLYFSIVFFFGRWEAFVLREISSIFIHRKLWLSCFSTTNFSILIPDLFSHISLLCSILNVLSFSNPVQNCSPQQKNSNIENYFENDNKNKHKGFSMTLPSNECETKWRYKLRKQYCLLFLTKVLGKPSLVIIDSVICSFTVLEDITDRKVVENFFFRGTVQLWSFSKVQQTMPYLCICCFPLRNMVQVVFLKKIALQLPFLH